MKPKSRLYALVRNWTNKPIQIVKEAPQGSLRIPSGSCQLEIKDWLTAQELSYEPVLSVKDLTLHSVILQELNECSEEDVIRLFKQGISAANYWQSSAKPISIVMPMKTDWLCHKHMLNSIQNALFNCHLPIGLIQVALLDRPSTTQEAALQEALIKLQRIGILLQLRNFEANEYDCLLLQQHSFTSIDISSQLIRLAIPGSECEKKLIQILNIAKKNHSICITGPLRLLHDTSVVKKHGFDAHYGPVVMPTMTLHQILKINGNATQKIAIKSHLKHQESN
jgi:EAL domain-containing protein (putative c-di-GMP-specific phosphodiesterase class I)